MIEGWLEIRHPADYPVWRSLAASNICGPDQQEAEVIRPQSGDAANACTPEEQRLIDLPHLSLLSTTNAQ